MEQQQREKLFNYMLKQHDVLLSESDLDEVENMITPKEGFIIKNKYQPKEFKPYIVNIGNFRPDPKPEKVVKPKKKYRFIKKSTGEAEIFEKIWNERPHKSQISGEIIHEPKAINFLHVLPKGQNKYPEFKLNMENIILGTAEEHHIWDNARHLISDINDETSHYNWKMVFELEQQLKIKYKKEYGF